MCVSMDGWVGFDQDLCIGGRRVLFVYPPIPPLPPLPAASAYTGEDRHGRETHTTRTRIRAACLLRAAYTACLPFWRRRRGGRPSSCSWRCSPGTPSGSLWGGRRRRKVVVGGREGMRVGKKNGGGGDDGREGGWVCVFVHTCGWMYVCMGGSKARALMTIMDPHSSTHIIHHTQRRQARSRTGFNPRNARVGGGEGDVVVLREPHGLAALPPQLVQPCFWYCIVVSVVMGVCWGGK